ncbi:hypothetical protein [Brucella pituitosa]|uniref:Type II and III secretion system protein n=1 Tax=Brucella pituitosa TaxID=571256 RepID=A0A643F0K2_9HYPH|nr:hypothetical protein [Brucella pituitosa]KAB0571286.1 type II and III secretion system protein [Brucella pituitosa]
MSHILDVIKVMAGVAIGIVLASIYYNGVPVLKDIPYIGAAFEGQAKKGMVPEFQALALKAELAQLKLIRRANGLVIEAYQVQLRNARAAEAAQVEKSEQEIAGYEKRLADAGRVCLLDRDDIEFLRK